MELSVPRRLGALLVSAVVLASLTVATVATPVAAANPKVTFVNGIPGVKVDVCIGNNETKSGLPYGARVQRSLLPGTRNLKVYKANPGKCAGQRLAQRSLTVAADQDLTLVVTKFAPKFVEFDNTTVPDTQPQSANLVFRHAGDLGPATLAFLVSQGVGLTPAAYPPFNKGDQAPFELANFSVKAIAQRLGKTFASSRWVDLPFVTVAGDTFGNRHIEFILVGTNPRNARFVVIDRPPLP